MCNFLYSDLLILKVTLNSNFSINFRVRGLLQSDRLTFGIAVFMLFYILDPQFKDYFALRSYNIHVILYSGPPTFEITEFI
jgi:hypothetical protein